MPASDACLITVAIADGSGSDVKMPAGFLHDRRLHQLDRAGRVILVRGADELSSDARST